MSDEQPPFTSSKELAAQMGCSERYLKKMARDTGYCRTFGHKVFFLQQDIDALMEHLKQVPRNPYLAARAQRIAASTGKKKASSGNAVEEALRLLRDQREERKKDTRR